MGEERQEETDHLQQAVREMRRQNDELKRLREVDVRLEVMARNRRMLNPVHSAGAGGECGAGGDEELLRAISGPGAVTSTNPPNLGAISASVRDASRQATSQRPLSAGTTAIRAGVTSADVPMRPNTPRTRSNKNRAIAAARMAQLGLMGRDGDEF